MKKDNRDLSQVYDLFAIRVIVDDVKDCYGVLGIVHSLWKPLPYRFKDYIAMPKPNNYQSLHTTVIGTRGSPSRSRSAPGKCTASPNTASPPTGGIKKATRRPIRTLSMKRWAGCATSWNGRIRAIQGICQCPQARCFFRRSLRFFAAGRRHRPAPGAIPIDFAYRIHTDVGHRCVGAKINGKIVPLDYKLKNGDIVEIITSKVGKPSLDWLNIVGSSESRSKIRSWFKKENREENIAKGLDALERNVSAWAMTGKPSTSAAAWAAWPSR